MKINEWLRAVRGERSQAEVARLAKAADPGCPNLYQSRIGEWERGPDRPSLRQLVAICDGLELDVAQRAAGRAVWDAAELDRSSAA